jgi:hypothetical protein
MSVIKKTLFDDRLEKVNVLINDTDPNSTYFKITELNDTLTGGKNAFLIQGSEYLVADTLIKIQIKDANGNIIYHEPGEGIVSASVGGEPIITEYYEGTSKVVAVYIYPNKTIDANGNPLDGTAFGPATITILGELKEYESNGLRLPVPDDWKDTYNVKWTRTVNVNPSLANVTKIRFYKRPTATIKELLQPLYSIDGGTGLKVDSGISQSFAQINLSNLETFAGDVRRVKVFRTSQADISDYDLIQDVLLESKELLTTFGLSGSVIGETGIFTPETLKNYWNTGSLKAELTSSRIESGLKLSGSGIFTYSQSLDISSTNTYELNLDAFYSSSVSSNLGIYLSYTTESKTVSSSIGTLFGTTPTKNLSDTVIPFSIGSNYPSASLYFSQSNGEWHLGNVSLKLSQDTAFSPDSVSFITTMPTILGNDLFNFKFEFYDLNNNYVPVFVTQSATFVGAPNTTALISASLSSSLDLLFKVSSSISGTMTTYSSSASSSILTLSSSVSTSVLLLTGSISSSLSSSFGFTSSSIFTLSGSVSSSLSSLSSSVSQSVYQGLLSSFTRVQQLADGNYSGSFISGNIIYAPVIGGQLGYFSTLFKVGKSPNSIYLDARQTPRKIFIGGVVPPSGDTESSGAFNNTNTPVYLDSTGKFSLGNKLSYDGENLLVNGNITVTGGNAATDANALLYSARAAASASVSASAAQSNAASDATTKANAARDAAILTAAGDATTKSDAARVAAISAASSDATTKSNTAFNNAAAQVKLLADGGYTGTFISSKEIFSPVVGGNVGYFSDQFRVGNAGIVLDGTNKRIYIGSGTYGNANTGFYVDNSGNFSLGSKLTFTGGNLSVTGTITAGGGTIGPWNIASDAIYFGTKTASGNFASAGNITLGQSWISSANFRVDTNGSAFFNGRVDAASGTIGGWVINPTTLSTTNGIRSITLNSTTGYITFGGDAILEFLGPGRIDFLGSGGIQMPETSLGIYMKRPLAGGNATGGGHSVYICSTTSAVIEADNNGTGAPSFYGKGYISTTGNIFAYSSDKRLKENVKLIENPLDKVDKLNGVHYKWKDEVFDLGFIPDTMYDTGLLAQEVQAVLPDAVKNAPFDSEYDHATKGPKSKSGNNYLTVQYEKLVPLLVEAIKELRKELNELKNK